MYTVNQGPSKIVAKTRTGLSQNYEKIESIRKIKSNNGQSGTKANNGQNASQSSANGSDNGNKEMDINVAKPVFQQYRRTNSNRNNNSFKSSMQMSCFKDDEPQPVLSPQYEELIRFLRDSWNNMSAECEEANEQHQSTTNSAASSTTEPGQSININRNGFKRTKKVIVYHNDPPSPALDDFGPFDLESWWGRRLFNNITKSL